jgi:hypothetical protein
MDRLRAFVLVHHAIVERQIMSMKLRGLTSSLAQLHHDLDAQAEKLTDRIAVTKDRGAAVFAQAHKRLDGAAQDLAEVDKLLSDLENTNGGPILDDSSESSVPHPQASWSPGK